MNRREAQALVGLLTLTAGAIVSYQPYGWETAAGVGLAVFGGGLLVTTWPRWFN